MSLEKEYRLARGQRKGLIELLADIGEDFYCSPILANLEEMGDKELIEEAVSLPLKIFQYFRSHDRKLEAGQLVLKLTIFDASLGAAVMQKLPEGYLTWVAGPTRDDREEFTYLPPGYSESLP